MFSSTRSLRVLMASLALSFSASALANDAGCGFGSIVVAPNSKLLQLFAVTTNHSFFSQELGITFGTSGCSASGIVQLEKQIQYFAEVNQDDLAREMAQGHGEKLTTLAILHGCSNNSQIDQFSAQTQSSYEVIFPSAKTSAVDMVKHLQSTAAPACRGS